MPSIFFPMRISPRYAEELDHGRPCYELYLNDHESHPEKKFIIDFCEPVKPL
jgi:hypothetical protein